MLFSIRLCFFLTISLGTLNSAAVASECSNLLSLGVFDTYSKTTSYSNFSSTQDSYCANYQSLRQSGQSADANLLTEVFYFSGSFNANELNAFSDAICGNSNQGSSVQNAQAIFNSTADSNLAAAFNACVAAEARGLHYDVREIGSLEGFEISAYYTGLGGPISVGKLIITRGGLIPNDTVTCRGDLASAANTTQLGLESKTLVCTRNVHFGDPKVVGSGHALADLMDVTIPTAQGPIVAARPAVPLLPIGAVAPGSIDANSYDVAVQNFLVDPSNTSNPAVCVFVPTGSQRSAVVGYGQLTLHYPNDLVVQPVPFNGQNGVLIKLNLNQADLPSRQGHIILSVVQPGLQTLGSPVRYSGAYGC